MGTVEATLRARAGRATPLAGRLALAYWCAALRALALPVALLYRLAPALRLDPGAFREAAARAPRRGESLICRR